MAASMAILYSHDYPIDLKAQQKKQQPGSAPDIDWGTQSGPLITLHPVSGKTR
jgi:hypothetical protein